MRFAPLARPGGKSPEYSGCEDRGRNVKLTGTCAHLVHRRTPPYRL